MGYESERASLNQYSDLQEYCEKNVYNDLKEIFKSAQTKNSEINREILKIVYSPKENPIQVPLLSFDGGMANLFVGRETELCLLKVAGACPPDSEIFFKEGELKEIFFHCFVGQIISAEDDNKSKEVVQKEVLRLQDLKEFKNFLRILGVTPDEFSKEFFKLVEKWKDKSTIKDSLRELLEWALVIDFIAERKVGESESIPYLIIKDGNLSSNPKAITGLLSNKIKDLLNGKNETIKIPYLIGAVKASRYTGDSPIGHVVKRFSKKVKSHEFFRLPAKFEAVADKDFKDKAFQRYFLKIFEKNIFEIQIPNVIKENEAELHHILDLIASQITFSYGGTISTNSFAHQKASLSEAESKGLEKEIFIELNKDTEVNNGT